MFLWSFMTFGEIAKPYLKPDSTNGVKNNDNEWSINYQSHTLKKITEYKGNCCLA